MFLKSKFKIIVIRLLLAFIVVYGCSAYMYVKNIQEHFEKQIQIHSKIIAFDVWNLNSSGVKAYLQLVIQTERYKGMEILIEESELFLQVDGPPVSGIDKIFVKCNLIPTRVISSVIEYDQHKVGVIQGELFDRTIYSLFTLLVFQSFAFLIIVFIRYLFFNRNFLEQEIQERTRRYLELVNLLPVMVLETDAEGNIIFANEIATKQFGIDEFTDRVWQISDVLELVGDQKGSDDLTLLKHFEEIEQIEYLAKKNDGSTFSVLMKSAQIVRGDRVLGARVVLMDITERCVLEEQLNRDQKMKSIGMMAGGVAHDLNNILSGLINYPELILQKFPNDKALHKYVEPMKSAGLRAAEVVADLLMVARGVAAPRTISNLDHLVEDYVTSPEFHQLQSAYPDFAYKLDLASSGENISCSLIHIRKCLMNLVANGVEAMTGVGCITIATTVLEIKRMETPYGEIGKGNYVVLSVSDTGSGITQSDLKHIFEPFYSKKEMGRSGTGLGLAVVWNILQDHNGGVNIQTGKGGTVFTLYFPCTSKLGLTECSDDIHDIHLGDNQKILIIDDELQQRDIALELLQSLGYRAAAVSSGEEAITYLQENSVDLLLLDMVIVGSRLNGRETYERILRKTPEQKAIIISGFSESDDVKGAMQLGAGKLINKPYTKEKLAEAVYLELHR